jgi:hypothetical protein
MLRYAMKKMWLRKWLTNIQESGDSLLINLCLISILPRIFDWCNFILILGVILGYKRGSSLSTSAECVVLDPRFRGDDTREKNQTSPQSFLYLEVLPIIFLSSLT